MPFTKNNFLQLREWCTLKQLNGKGFMPIGEPLRLQPSGYRAESINYYSPYEVRRMTDAELDDYNAGRKIKVKCTKKLFGTLFDQFKEYYTSIIVKNSQKYKKVTFIQNLLLDSHRSHGGYEICIHILNESNVVILQCNLTTICTRITRGSSPCIFFDYYDICSTSEDSKCIKSVVDVKNKENCDSLISIKKILFNTESVDFSDTSDFRYINPNDFCI